MFYSKSTYPLLAPSNCRAKLIHTKKKTPSTLSNNQLKRIFTVESFWSHLHVTIVSYDRSSSHIQFSHQGLHDVLQDSWANDWKELYSYDFIAYAMMNGRLWQSYWVDGTLQNRPNLRIRPKLKLREKSKGQDSRKRKWNKAYFNRFKNTESVMVTCGHRKNFGKQVCMYMCIYIYIYMCVCVCVYIYMKWISLKFWVTQSFTSLWAVVWWSSKEMWNSGYIREY